MLIRRSFGKKKKKKRRNWRRGRNRLRGRKSVPHFLFFFLDFFVFVSVQGYKLGRQTPNLEGFFARYNCTYL